MIYRNVSLVILFVISSYSLLQGQKVYSKKELNNGLDQLILDKKKKKSDENEYSLLLAVKAEINRQDDSINVLNESLLLTRAELQRSIDKPAIVIPCKPMPPLTNIKTVVWASQNLTKDELYGYFELSLIKEARNDAAWEEAFLNNQPAFCYHKLDKSKEFGILLNVPAIIMLRKKLAEKESEFRFPNADDIQKLNELGKTLKLSPLQMFSLGTDPRQAKPFQWKSPGIDLFGFSLPALSYRRNLEDDEWHGGNAASFYCDDPGDPEWRNGIVLAELSAEGQKWELLPGMVTKGDYSNIGSYIRLIYKQ